MKFNQQSEWSWVSDCCQFKIVRLQTPRGEKFEVSRLGKLPDGQPMWGLVSFEPTFEKAQEKCRT